MDDQGYYSNNKINSTNSGANRRTNRQSVNNAWQEPRDSNPDANANAPVNANTDPQTQQDPTQPQHSDGFTMIPPIESRRSKLQRMAQKEEEDFQRWKEANRPGPVQLAPERLGGAVSLAEARDRQLVELRHSKLKKQLRKEELDQQRRQAEEEEDERMKAKQREKAERLEERREQEDRRRREVLAQDHLRRTEQFLQRVERSDAAPVALTSASHTSPWARAQEYRAERKEEENTALQLKKKEQRMKSEVLEEKDSDQEEERRRELRRGRSAFLDRLQGGGTEVAGGQMELQRPPVVMEEDRRDWQTHSQTSRPQDTFTSPEPDPAHSTSEWREETIICPSWLNQMTQQRASWDCSERAWSLGLSS
ncbi:epithelial-stromal interaction protein 1 isoform X2 [Coregonus clupeaformis]|uniref:epithelial-stromal interaction protein 1 isoform X2 n=1 Tax=Coregonus clupeaformis TaxID=59861 RepID=UPI001BDFC3AF|nr:epithelial-stromal interaction protein 1 isoform X2 [Coregonus clupeaformis]